MHSSFISCQAVRKLSYLPRKWRSKAARSRPALSTTISIEVSRYPRSAPTSISASIRRARSDEEAVRVSVSSTRSWDLQSLPSRSARGGRLVLRHRALGGIGAEVRGERELHQLRQQFLDLLRLSHDDALVDDPEDAADDRFLERFRQLLAVRRHLPAHPEERHEGLQRALVALDRRRARRERLDDA